MSGNDVSKQATECFDRVATPAERDEVAVCFMRSEFMAGAERMREVIAPHDAELAEAFYAAVSAHAPPASAAEAFAAVNDRSLAESFLAHFGASLASYGPEAVVFLSSCPRLSLVLRHERLRRALPTVPDEAISALSDMLDRFDISGPECLRAAGIEPVSTGAA